MKPQEPTRSDANQGEGDRASARRYNEEVSRFAHTDKVESAARAAEEYVEQSPADAARAERKARRGPRASRLSLAELMAMARSFAERLRPLALRMIGALRARLHRK